MTPVGISITVLWKFDSRLEVFSWSKLKHGYWIKQKIFVKLENSLLDNTSIISPNNIAATFYYETFNISKPISNLSNLISKTTQMFLDLRRKICSSRLRPTAGHQRPLLWLTGRTSHAGPVRIGNITHPLKCFPGLVHLNPSLFNSWPISNIISHVNLKNLEVRFGLNPRPLL